MSEPLWRPADEQIQQANMTAFMVAVEKQWGVGIADSDALYDFSIAERGKFWISIKDFAAIKAETWGERALVDGDKMPGAKWFPDARLNFAENLLGRRDGADAMVFWGEDKVKRRLSFADLYAQVSVLAQALRDIGVKPGDRVAGYLPNMPETIVAMLAATSLGAVWSSCSPDFGVTGVLDRLGQIEPKVVFSGDGYRYNGKRHDSLAKIADITAGLPSVEAVVIVPYGDGGVPDIAPVLASTPGAVPLDDAELQRITQFVTDLTNKEVVVTTQVDEEILGGIVIQIGDQLLDGSTRTRLESLRKRVGSGVISA